MARSTRTLVTAAVLGTTTMVSALYGFLIGEAFLARRAIGTTDARPPPADGVYGDDLGGPLVRCLVLGDSAAVGYGMTRADATPPAMIGFGLAQVLDSPVEVRSHAVVGAKAEDLEAQLEAAAGFDADVVVIVIGANDVTHQIPPRRAARDLAAVVATLVEDDIDVVVGTCPDLGTITKIAQPLRFLARLLSRRLARLQTIAVVKAGGRAVSLGGLLGPVFAAQREVMFGEDQFHPSRTGYANMVSVLLPAITASWNERRVRDEVYAGQPRAVMSVADAAAQASQHPGTQVVRTGRLATVLRHKRR